MSPSAFAEGLLRRLDRQIEDATFRLAQGSAPDFAAYKKAVGHLEGLREARDLISATFNEEHDAAG